MFGPFVLIPEQQALFRGEVPVRLGHRALEILAVLVKRPGELVTKQDLISQVWPDTFVDESNLKVNVAAIRKALDQDGAHPSCIATVVGRGYRFIAPVHTCGAKGRAWPPSHPWNSHVRECDWRCRRANASYSRGIRVTAVSRGGPWRRD